MDAKCIAYAMLSNIASYIRCYQGRHRIYDAVFDSIAYAMHFASMSYLQYRQLFIAP